MNECKECELAVYCYSDSTTWVFRTKEEMQEKREAMLQCPCHQQMVDARQEAAQESLKARIG